MKVSIVITCFNREKYIARAIRSACSQAFPVKDLEVIVVDDGSTDASPQIIRDFGDDIITIFNNKNQGLPAARNAGIKRAKGRFILHLDSDDYLHDETIKMLSLHLAYNMDWGAVACDYIEVDNHENHLQRGDASKDPIACGILFRKDALIDIGLYDEDMLLLEDKELRYRFEKKYYIGHCQVPFYRYVQHSGNMTNDACAIKHYENMLQQKNGKKSL